MEATANRAPSSDPAAPAAAVAVAGGAVPVRDSVLLGAAALLLYLALGQHALHGDGPFLLEKVAERDPYQAYHSLFLSLAIRWSDLLGALGLSLYAKLLLLDQVSTAFGVAVFHRAGVVLGLGRARAALAAGLLGGCSSIVYYATVVEMHALFFAAAGVAAWSAAHLARAPGLARGLVTGACCGFAFLVHGAGLLLPWLLGAVVLARARPRGRGGAAQLVPALAAMAGSHALLAFAVPAWLGLGGQPAAALQFVGLGAQAWQLGVGQFVAASWREALEPYAPVSFLFALGFLRADLRRLAWATLVAAVPYVGATLLLLGPLDEHGAYLAPLAWPAAMLVARALPPRAVLVALALGLLLAVVDVKRHDHNLGREYASGANSILSGQRAILLIASLPDFEGCYVGGVDAELISTWDLFRVTNDPGRLPAALGQIEEHLRARLRAGWRILLTEGVLEFGRNPQSLAHSPGVVATLRALAEHFDCRAVAAGGFQATELVERP